MNPTIAHHLAQQKMNGFDHEADADRLVAQARAARVRQPGLIARLTRSAGRVRLVVRSATA